MNIVFCTDTNYIMPSSVLIKSISINNSDSDIEYYAIIDESVTGNDIKILENELNDFKNHNINFVRVNGTDFENMPNLDISKEYARNNRITATHTTKACYYRLAMANILPDNVDKVLYFDCDIVVTQSLKSLWNTNLDGKAVAAVVDEGELQMSYDKLGYSSEKGYFNSGSMIIDLNYWRSHNVFDEFLRIIEEHRGKMRQHDQEILNIAFHDNVKRLPIKYNLQENFLRHAKCISQFYHLYSDDIEDALKDYAVIHFTAEKPWFKECGQPLIAVFKYYLSKTVWSDYVFTWKNPKLAFNISLYRTLVKLKIKDSIYRSIH